MNKKIVGINYKVLPLKFLIETEGNPQKMTKQELDGMSKSMKEKGWILDSPVVWERPDGKYQIISGHHRVQAGVQAGIIETGCKVINGLSENQVKMFLIEANQRKGRLDTQMLDDLISDIIGSAEISKEALFDEVGIYESEEEEIDFEDEADSFLYTRKVEAPVYEIKGEKPDLKEMADVKKYNDLCSKINKSNIDEGVKAFLRLSASRLIVFDYSKIAEFYAHADFEVQDLMERLALVIIDFDKAIEYGFAQMTKEFTRQIESDNEEIY